jgi:hypothetical protein
VAAISPSPPPEAPPTGLYSASLVLSGARCVLTYLVVPALTPLLHLAPSFRHYAGIPASLLALAFDLAAARRLARADIRHRVALTALYLLLASLMVVLLAADVAALA